jgi:hypothetical protein
MYVAFCYMCIFKMLQVVIHFLNILLQQNVDLLYKFFCYMGAFEMFVIFFLDFFTREKCCKRNFVYVRNISSYVVMANAKIALGINSISLLYFAPMHPPFGYK